VTSRAALTSSAGTLPFCSRKQCRFPADAHVVTPIRRRTLLSVGARCERHAGVHGSGLTFLVMRQVMPMAAGLASGLALSSFSVVSAALTWGMGGHPPLEVPGVQRGDVGAIRAEYGQTALNVKVHCRQLARNRRKSRHHQSGNDAEAWPMPSPGQPASADRPGEPVATPARARLQSRDPG
jgi:hypothetical protein